MIERPDLYEKGGTVFWRDEYISKQLLVSHLDSNFEGASRSKAFIVKSSQWISEVLPSKRYPCLLDLGCGPGLYAEEFALRGYDVTGLDFSKNSIDYAEKSASEKELDITYLCQDYLSLDVENNFDCITLIYCDYGALSADDRKLLLQKIYHALKENGKLLLDVFSDKKYQLYHEAQTWQRTEKNGFWSKSDYLELKGCYKYQDNITLEQYTILTEDDLMNYYSWTTYFTKTTLIKELKQAGFTINAVYSDVAGGEYDKDNGTIAVIAGK